MTLQQFQYAVTVAEQASMNKATGVLFLSQSSLSASIQNLENEIGISIFHRTNRGVSVTPEGEEILLHARQIVEQYRITEEKYVLKQDLKPSGYQGKRTCNAAEPDDRPEWLYALFRHFV